MSHPQTGTYDLFLALTEPGLERVIQAAFLESWARNGLPVVYRQSPPNDSREFVLFFGLPTVSLDPSRDIDGGVQRINNAIGIRLPFSDSAIIDKDNPNNSRFNQEGALTIILPVIGNGNLAINFSQLLVWHEPYTLLSVILEPLLTEALREQPPEQLAAVLAGTGLGRFQNIPGCPPTDSGEAFSDEPTIVVPRTFLGIDPEMHADPGSSLSMLQLKAKMAPRALATGTALDTAAGNTAWVAGNTTPELGLLLSNRFLLEELLPPTLIRTLLVEQIESMEAEVRLEVEEDEAFEEASDEARDQEINRRIGEVAYPALVSQHFSFPLTLSAPIPRTFPLPTLEDIMANPQNPDSVTPDTPNCLITAVSTTIFPGLSNSTVNIGLTLTGGSIGYTFTANITIELIFSHQGGELRIVPHIPDPQVNVRLDPLVYIAAAVVGLILLGPIGAFVALLATIIIDALMDGFAAASVQSSMTGQIDADDLRLNDFLDFMLVRRVQLDDLVISGAFRIDHDWQGVRRSRAAVIERESIAFEQEQQATANAPNITFVLQPDGPSVVQINATANEIQPAANIRLFDFGLLPQHRADNFCQADLRTLPLANYQSGAISLAGSLMLERHVFGLCAVDGIYEAYALLQVWRNPLGQLHGFLRFYRQTQPDLRLNTRWSSGLLLHTCTLTGEISDNIEVPVMIGAGVVDTGSIAVGVQTFSCAHEILVDAVPHRLRPPISHYSWTVLLKDGSTHPLSEGAANIIDVDLSASTTSPVTFELLDNGVTCFIQTEEGKSGRFELQAMVTEMDSTEMDSRVHSAKTEIQFEGNRINAFGFNRWLDQFERIMTLMARDLGIPRDPGTIDPVRVDLHGSTIYPDRQGELTRLDRDRWGGRTNDLVLLQPKGSVKDLLARDRNGELGLQSSDLVRAESGGLWHGPRRRLDGRAVPPGLFGQEAKKELHARVSSGFAQMREMQGVSRELARYERQIISLLLHKRYLTL